MRILRADPDFIDVIYAHESFSDDLTPYTRTKALSGLLRRLGSTSRHSACRASSALLGRLHYRLTDGLLYRGIQTADSRTCLA